MRISGPATPPTWVAMKMAQQVFVQAGSHASQPTAKPVEPVDRVQTTPGSRPLTSGRLDVRA